MLHSHRLSCAVVGPPYVPPDGNGWMYKSELKDEGRCRKKGRTTHGHRMKNPSMRRRYTGFDSKYCTTWGRSSQSEMGIDKKIWDTRPFPSCTAVRKRYLGKCWPSENREKRQSVQSPHPQAPLEYGLIMSRRRGLKGLEWGEPPHA